MLKNTSVFFFLCFEVPLQDLWTFSIYQISQKSRKPHFERMYVSNGISYGGNIIITPSCSINFHALFSG
ncbi:unnamed protein product [Caenorhabditis nigoni]